MSDRHPIFCTCGCETPKLMGVVEDGVLQLEARRYGETHRAEVSLSDLVQGPSTGAIEVVVDAG